MSQQDDEDQAPGPEEAILEGKLDSVKAVLDVLSFIYSPAHKGQDLTISIHSEGGLRFGVEHTGSLQASVIIPTSSFSSFRSSDDSTRLRLNLSLLMECLNLFVSTGSTPTSAHFWYCSDGHPLVIRLWDGDAYTVCQLTTLAMDLHHLPADMGFYSDQVITSTIVSCDILKDAFMELDYCGATTAEIRLSPTQPHFLLCSPAATVAADLDGLGDDALCTVELPDPLNSNEEVFHSFLCRRIQCSVYKLQHLQRCKHALNLADTCHLQMNAEGMLSIVCRMKHADPDRGRSIRLKNCFVEFLIAAQEIDEDDQHDDEPRDEHQQADGDGDETGRFLPFSGAQRVQHDDEEEQDDDELVPGTPLDP